MYRLPPRLSWHMPSLSTTFRVVVGHSINKVPDKAATKRCLLFMLARNVLSRVAKERLSRTGDDTRIWTPSLELTRAHIIAVFVPFSIRDSTLHKTPAPTSGRTDENRAQRAFL